MLIAEGIPLDRLEQPKLGLQWSCKATYTLLPSTASMFINASISPLAATVDYRSHAKLFHRA
jgi:hypothetical protein